MKRIFFFLFFLSLFSQSFALTEDNSLVEELSSQNTKPIKLDYTLKTFNSCSDFETEMQTYLKAYWEKNYSGGYPYRFYGAMDDVVEVQSQDMAKGTELAVPESPQAQQNNVGNDFSATNVQVGGVDEADIVKTDGTYLYYYNQTEHAVFIAKGKDASGKLQLVKKINLPQTLSSPQIYIDTNRLVLVSSGYSATDYSQKGYLIDRNSRTYTIVFDTTDIENLVLLKLASSDGNYTESRKIGDYLYIVSQNSFHFPYWKYSNVDDIVFDASLLLPTKTEISKTSENSSESLEIGGKKYPYSISTTKIADCSHISYNFPDLDSLDKVNFNPGFTIISAMNIRDPESEISTHVIAGSGNNVYMSQENLYVTESIWKQDNFSCPLGALCAQRFYWGGTQHTLVHKIEVDKKDMKYKNTILVPGSPLNQYSMDEHNGNFRIITSQWSPNRETDLYIFDKNFQNISSLTGIAPNENFQSSRFLGNKLFLVTFEQVDPLFAIDLSDDAHPKILGELKIPGFSTYLHPYDENHLIGIGYDTRQNQWGGTQTSGIKVDLYTLHYDKKCGDANLTQTQKEKCDSGEYKGIIVEQSYTQTFGGKGSYSEALNNPRMFVWNANRKTLLLPVTLSDYDDSWRMKDYYNGLASIKIDANSGIRLENKISHIDMSNLESQRIKDCQQYTSENTQQECRELLNGQTYCVPKTYNYVPEYCYKDATIWQYIGSNMGQFQKQSITRVAYIGDSVYAFSDALLGRYDWNLQENDRVKFSQ